MKYIQHTPNIWTIDGFLPLVECENLIKLSEEIGYKEAEVSLSTGSQMIKGIRNNYRILYENIDLAQQFWQILKDFCPEKIDNMQAIGLNELFRFYKYELNQRFKKHKDGRFKRNEKQESRITFMIYLNDNFEGGETNFEEIKIQPKKGMALCFIHELKHEGMPIIEGIKYVLRSDIMYEIL